MNINGILGVGALVRAMWNRVVEKKTALARLRRGQANATERIR